MSSSLQPVAPVDAESSPSPEVLNEDDEPDEKSGPRSALPVLAERYALRRFLDRGGTASVYLADDLRTHETVAVKVLSDHAARSVALKSHFLQGYRAIVNVTHESVVRVFSVEEPEQGEPFVVMEPLQGAPLSDLLVAGQQLDLRSALRLIAQAALGLAALHEKGVTHCDIKPENLFIVGAPEAPDRLKIIDFGMAAVNGHDAPGDPYTVRGTAQYMAPEQILGDPVDARTDVYSLGVTLFRMITGHLPFDLKLSPTLLRHQLVSPAPPPTWLREDLDPGVERIVLRALAKHPHNRYETARQLLSDIELSMSGHGDEIVTPAPRVVPDIYTPQTTRGEAAATVLGANF